MANHRRPIDVSPEDRLVLEGLVRAATTPAGLHRRARAVLLMADGLPGTVIADRTGYTPVQISRVRARYAAEGVLGLGERPRSGQLPDLGEGDQIENSTRSGFSTAEKRDSAGAARRRENASRAQLRGRHRRKQEPGVLRHLGQADRLPRGRQQSACWSTGS